MGTINTELTKYIINGFSNKLETYQAVGMAALKMQVLSNNFGFILEKKTLHLQN